MSHETVGISAKIFVELLLEWTFACEELALLRNSFRTQDTPTNVELATTMVLVHVVTA